MQIVSDYARAVHARVGCPYHGAWARYCRHAGIDLLEFAAAVDRRERRRLAEALLAREWLAVPAAALARLAGEGKGVAR
jgi:hypothetical protein